MVYTKTSGLIVSFKTKGLLTYSNVSYSAKIVRYLGEGILEFGPVTTSSSPQKLNPEFFVRTNRVRVAETGRRNPFHMRSVSTDHLLTRDSPSRVSKRPNVEGNARREARRNETRHEMKQKETMTKWVSKSRQHPGREKQEHDLHPGTRIKVVVRALNDHDE
jgi:hypothetical protein